MPGPLALYRAQVDAGQLLADAAQSQVATELERLFQAIRAHVSPRWWSLKKSQPPQGIYLVGAVGRGKTLLMDLFAQALTDQHIPHRRVHFHRFMADTQASIQARQGDADPLADIAKALASQYRVLCFDEFHVEDIGDAMILGELLTQLFAQGVVLVATSNTPPDQLYADGLQRARFLPAIDQIKAHTRLVALDATTDYRLRTLTQAGVYFYPLSAQTDAELSEVYRHLTGQAPSGESVVVHGRAIETIGWHSRVAWFDFAALCASNRAANDYIALADRFDTLIIANVPQLIDGHNDAAKRFMHLIDEAYDRGVKVVMSAACPANELYAGHRLKTGFDRTTSRLLEMQSLAYLESARR